jgi:DNA-nicking Smr family endonuclease
MAKVFERGEMPKSSKINKHPKETFDQFMFSGMYLENEDISEEQEKMQYLDWSPSLDFELGDVSAEDKLAYKVDGFSAKQWAQLQRGQISVDARLDLHGQDREMAFEHLRFFLAKACHQGQRCVLIVHGKGKTKAFPALKNMLAAILPKHPRVIAYCSAPEKMGGTGAALLMLKHSNRKNRDEK